jgi:hypothetical protein
MCLSCVCMGGCTGARKQILLMRDVVSLLVRGGCPAITCSACCKKQGCSCVSCALYVCYEVAVVCVGAAQVVTHCPHASRASQESCGQWIRPACHFEGSMVCVRTRLSAMVCCLVGPCWPECMGVMFPKRWWASCTAVWGLLSLVGPAKCDCFMQVPLCPGRGLGARLCTARCISGFF